MRVMRSTTSSDRRGAFDSNAILLSRCFQGVEAFEGARQRSHPVMNHAPEIEDEPVIAGRQRSDASNQRNVHAACPNITSRFYREEQPRARTRSRAHMGDLGV